MRIQLVRAGALIPSTFALTSCREGVLDPHGPIGRAEVLMLYDATAIMLAVIVPVMLLTLIFAWWFRAGNRRARYRPEWEYSGRIEMIVWSIPALVILFLGGVAWIGSHDLDPPKRLASQVPEIEVQVVSLDWQWLFIYPQQAVASLNRLVIPAGVPVHFSLTSASVMNSFFIPQLGSQIYTMAGMTTQLSLQADAVGTYQGLSAQFSGDGFSDMRFEVVAVPAADFAVWTDRVHRGNTVLDRASFVGLMQPTVARERSTFGSVESGLFNVISSGELTGRAAAKVRP
jgi:cytochrome o ubiquinol oxidase subunit 2